MKSVTFALTALASLGTAFADGWYNNSIITTDITVTGYTTFCPVSTLVTITTCSDHKCAPHVYTVPEPSTLIITEECVFPTTIYGHHYPKPSETCESEYSTSECVTTDYTVTGYTTYCPESTVITITTCSEKKCAPHVYSVPTPTTLIITEECVFPTTYYTHTKSYETQETHSTYYTTSDVTVSGYTTYCPEPTIVTITTCSENKCAPHAYTVSEATTLTITEECVVPSVVVYTHTETYETQKTQFATTNVVSTDVTVTGFTTYCSEATIVTVTTCVENTCAAHQITVSEATTLTVTEPCLVSTVYTTAATITTYAVHQSQSSDAYLSTTAAVSTFAAGASKIAAGFAGVVGVVAFLV